MINFTIDSLVAQTLALLSHYGFDLKGYEAIDLLAQWLEKYQADWIRLAVIESLYRGRYKAVSVEQILEFWLKREQPLYNFNHDFERLICRKIPRNLTANLLLMSDPLSETTSATEVEEAEEFEELEIAPEMNAQSEATEEPQETTITPEEEPLEELIPAQKPFTPTTSSALVFQQRQSNKLVPYQADWSRVTVTQRPIDKFIPLRDTSGFYLKLKAVARKAG